MVRVHPSLIVHMLIHIHAHNAHLIIVFIILSLSFFVFVVAAVTFLLQFLYTLSTIAYTIPYPIISYSSRILAEKVEFDFGVGSFR